MLSYPSDLPYHLQGVWTQETEMGPVAFMSHEHMDPAGPEAGILLVFFGYVSQ